MGRRVTYAATMTGAGTLKAFRTFENTFALISCVFVL